MAARPGTHDRYAVGGLHKVQLYALHCDPAAPFMVLDFRPSNDPTMWGYVYALPFTMPDGGAKFSRGRQPDAAEDACQIQHAPFFFKLLDTLGHQSLVILMQVIEVLNDALLPGQGWSIVANNCVTARASIDPAEPCQQRFKILLQMFIHNTPRFSEVKQPASGMMAYCIYVPQEHNALLRDNHWVDSASQRHQDRFGGTVEPRECCSSSAMVNLDMDITSRPQYQYDSDTPDYIGPPAWSVVNEDEESVAVVSGPTYGPHIVHTNTLATDSDVEPCQKRKREN